MNILIVCGLIVSVSAAVHFILTTLYSKNRPTKIFTPPSACATRSGWSGYEKRLTRIVLRHKGVG
jgi:hypothetical protein